MTVDWFYVMVALVYAAFSYVVGKHYMKKYGIW